MDWSSREEVDIVEGRLTKPALFYIGASFTARDAAVMHHVPYNGGAENGAGFIRCVLVKRQFHSLAADS